MGIKNIFYNQTTLCKFSLRPSLVRPSPSMSSQQTPSKTLRLRSKTRKVSLQISKDLSSLESNSRMAEPSATTTSKRSPLSISSSDLEVECKSSSRHSLESNSRMEEPSQTTTSKRSPLSISSLDLEVEC